MANEKRRKQENGNKTKLLLAALCFVPLMAGVLAVALTGYYSVLLYGELGIGLVLSCTALLFFSRQYEKLYREKERLEQEYSRLEEMEAALMENERSKAVILENLQGMAYRCCYDRDWTMLYVSAGCFDLTGFYPENLLHNAQITFNDLILPQYQDCLWEKWKAVVREKTKLREEYEIRTASGKVKWVYEQGQAVYDRNGNVSALEGLIIDITERKEQEIKLRYISEHDLLTGLYNRRYFENRMKIELGEAPSCKKAILMVNIRNFRTVISAYGYDGGERLIKELGGKLLMLSGPDCELFHIAIDRFVFYLTGYSSKEELEELSENIINLMKVLESVPSVRGNIGIVEIGEGNRNVDHILKLASIAAEQANNNEAFQYCYFNKKMEEEIDRIEIIKSELKKTAENTADDSLYLLYQPIVTVKSGEIHCFEALARFKSESFGQISPNEFIPVAEESGLIIPLGKKIIEQAFAFLDFISKKGYGDVSVSVNISVIQLLREDFIEELIGLMKEEEVNSANLKIELTETVFSNHFEQINGKFDELRKMGIKIALDDFGTGYSSLARERELNIDYMKIDKYFIDKLLFINKEAKITGDIISIGHKLGHRVIAEGVEQEEQRQYLLEHNCDFIQGYLFSKPLTKERALEILEKERMEGPGVSHWPEDKIKGES